MNTPSKSFYPATFSAFRPLKVLEKIFAIKFLAPSPIKLPNKIFAATILAPNR